MLNVTNLPIEVDAPLTLEQRVAALEALVARLSLAAHNYQWVKHGSPKNKAGKTLAELIERESKRVAAEDDL